MKFKIEIPDSIISKVFNEAIETKNDTSSDIFSDIRYSFKKELNSIVIKSGINTKPNENISTNNRLKGAKVFKREIMNPKGVNLDILFCDNYGHDDYSFSGINYLYSNLLDIPSLTVFNKIEELSIGNILVMVENGDYDIEVKLEKGIKIVGYSYRVSSKIRKSFLCLFGIRFRDEHLKPIIKKYIHSGECKSEDLFEVQVFDRRYPVMFGCRICGKLYTCECFKGQFDIDEDILRSYKDLNRDHNEETVAKVESLKFRKGICHLCTKRVPTLAYSNIYSPSFVQVYGSYIKLFAYKNNIQHCLERERWKEPENLVREYLGYPLIGEKWISETMLFKTIQFLFPSNQVIHHYRGKELDGLELDVWLPELKIGVEYQGEQHYKVIEHWGGVEGLKNRKLNDQKKKKLCKELGYKLIEFKYNEDLTEDYVKKKIKGKCL
ncbi:MAG: hypothetical protein HQ517_02165 [SAR324 cluster bacterium]|nr:hypothetical protein [SAR324 cluster bacterium]